MKLILDTDEQTLTRVDGPFEQTVPLYSPEAFEEVSAVWVAVGWDQRYPYTFSWLGRPVIQLPEDMLRLQEVIYQVKPDVIVETGVAHGGSLIFLATLCHAMGQGRVLGIDVEIRPPNRQAIEAHRLSQYIELIEGDSVSDETLAAVRAQIGPQERVLVILDSDHSRDHVRRELERYGELVGPGGYIVATDGVMKDLSTVPRGHKDWTWDNPEQAATEFLEDHPEFERVKPPRAFDEANGLTTPTHWPGAWLRKRVA
ncbi:MAG: cephalosporin hydroxylase family protein [Myxococcota bacterium]